MTASTKNGKSLTIAASGSAKNQGKIATYDFGGKCLMGAYGKIDWEHYQIVTLGYAYGDSAQSTNTGADAGGSSSDSAGTSTGTPTTTDAVKTVAKANIGLIVGASVGGVVLLLIMIAVICCCCMSPS